MLLTEYDEKLHYKTVYEEGLENGSFAVLAGLVRAGLLPIALAANRMHITVEQFIQKMKE